jgi:hypothetical protein
VCMGGRCGRLAWGCQVGVDRAAGSTTYVRGSGCAKSAVAPARTWAMLLPSGAVRCSTDCTCTLRGAAGKCCGGGAATGCGMGTPAGGNCGAIVGGGAPPPDDGCLFTTICEPWTWSVSCLHASMGGGVADRIFNGERRAPREPAACCAAALPRLRGVKPTPPAPCPDLLYAPDYLQELGGSRYLCIREFYLHAEPHGVARSVI